MTNTSIQERNSGDFSEETGRFDEAEKIIEILSEEFSRDILNSFEDGASTIAGRHDRHKQHVYNRVNNKLKPFFLAIKPDRPFETAFKTSLTRELEPIIDRMPDTDLPSQDYIAKIEEIYTAWKIENSLLYLIDDDKGNAEALSGFDSIIYQDNFEREKEVKSFFNEISKDEPEENKGIQRFNDYQPNDSEKEEVETESAVVSNAEKLDEELGLDHNPDEIYLALENAVYNVGNLSIENGEVPEEVEELIEEFNEESDEVKLSQYKDNGSKILLPDGLSKSAVINRGKPKVTGEYREVGDFLIFYTEKGGTYKMTGMPLAERVGAIESPDQLEEIVDGILE